MNKIIDLEFSRTLHKKLNKTPHLIQVILGPRQVGKTTTLLKYLEENHSEQLRKCGPSF